MPGYSTSITGVGKRRSARLALSVRGRLSDKRGTQMAEFADLSQTGARLRLSASHALSETVRLEWLDCAASAKVVWQEGRLCGLEFDDPLPLGWVVRTRSAPAGKQGG